MIRGQFNTLTKKLKPKLKSNNPRVLACLLLEEVLGKEENLTKVLNTYKLQIQNLNEQNKEQKGKEKKEGRGTKKDKEEVKEKGKEKQEETGIKNFKDASLVQNFVYGVLRFYPRLEFISQQLLEKPIKEKDRILLYLIYLGLYQCLFTRIPDYAAISETVEAARLLEKPWGSNLINAVLRNFKRRETEINALIEKDLQAKYAHPLWWIKRIQNAWPQDWESILNANNEEPPFCLRVNLQKSSRIEYLEQLQKQGISAEAIPDTRAGILILNAMDVHQLPNFDKGFCSVQDGAAQFAAELLDCKPGHRVLDACSAPGGKTTHILENEPDVQELIALDISEERCLLIEENLKRLQLYDKNKVKIIAADAIDTNSWMNKISYRKDREDRVDRKDNIGKETIPTKESMIKFDRILLDAPCSASGIIRRHPDIKLLRKEKDIHKLQDQQFELLKALFPLLKEQGFLLYATCSLLPEENEELIAKFLNYQKDAKVLSISLPVGAGQTNGHQILPGQRGMDGFYYAKLIRITSSLQEKDSESGEKG